MDPGVENRHAGQEATGRACCPESPTPPTSQNSSDHGHRTLRLTTLPASVDLPTFSLGLDTPSKYLGGPSTGLTPASWSLGTGFTPSILGGYSASGWTPSLTAAAGAKTEFNPFEISLGATSSSTSKRRAFGADFLDRDEAATRGSTDSVFDLLATTPGSGGRKRALSSPAVEVGAGNTSFPFLSQPSQFNPSPAALDRRTKRPRMASMQSSNLTSQEAFFSSFERESDESPASSVVLTPPDSAPTFAGGSPARKDIAVIATHVSKQVPPTAPPQPQQPLSALSRLAQERSALIARGQTVLSQASPLPIKQAAPATAPLAQADISVKAEPLEDSIASSRPGTANKPAPPPSRPPVTRGQSRRGTRSSIAVGNVASTSREIASPSPAVSLPTKRKAPRKKSSSAATATAAKRKESSVAAEDDDDDEEGPEGSDKRQQFLERNRVAACKSRQKKKEKVAGLEQCECAWRLFGLSHDANSHFDAVAADLCARNNILQQTAFALRQEALALRQLVHAHVGCSCEHGEHARH